MTDLFAIGDLVLSSDVSVAAWIVAGVRPFVDHVVGSLVPEGFAAYGRVFHPALLHGSGEGEVRWQQVADANGRQAHPAMEWGSITGSWQLQRQSGIWDQMPQTGSLTGREARLLADLLARHTTTADRCYFAVWEGFGSLDGLPQDPPRVQMPQRPMWLLRGPLSGAAVSMGPAWHQSASLWWPEDRAWCVATDVDLMTTYVGGSQRCIEALVDDADLDAMVVPVDQRVTWDTDTLNPPVPPP